MNYYKFIKINVFKLEIILYVRKVASSLTIKGCKALFSCPQKTIHDNE